MFGHYIQMTTQVRKNIPLENLLKLYTASMSIGPHGKAHFYLDELDKIFVSERIYSLILNTKTSSGRPWIPTFFWCNDQFPQENVFPDHDVIAIAHGTELSAVISTSLDDTEIWFRLFNNDARKKGLTDGLMYACTQSVSYASNGRVFYDSVFVSCIEHYGRVPSTRSLERDPKAKQILDTGDLDDQEKMDYSKVYIETKGYTPDTFTRKTFSVSINRTDDPDEPDVFEFHDGSDSFWSAHGGTHQFPGLLVLSQEPLPITPDGTIFASDWKIYPDELLTECHALGDETLFPIVVADLAREKSIVGIVSSILRDLRI